MPNATLTGEMAMPEDAEKPGENTKHHRALGAAVGAGVETYSELAERGGYGGMGIANKKWRDYGNATAILIIMIWMSVGIPTVLFWFRSDAKDDRLENRQQMARTEQLAEERRREDRQDRQRQEDLFRVQAELFRTTLETISRDNQKSTDAMTKVYEQVKIASDQMKAASEAMTRVEKMLTTKLPPHER